MNQIKINWQQNAAGSCGYQNPGRTMHKEGWASLEVLRSLNLSMPEILTLPQFVEFCHSHQPITFHGKVTQVVTLQ